MKKARTKVTAELLRKIQRLHDKGMASSEITGYVGLSVSSIDAYVRIIDAAFGEGSFCMNPKVYNSAALAEFCRDAGVMVPVNTFMAARNDGADSLAEKCYQMVIETNEETLIYNAPAKISNCLRAIMENLQMIAKAIDRIYKIGRAHV